MSSSDGSWAQLSSQNERVARAGETACISTDIASPAAPTEWAELASQSERLVADSDPLLWLANSRDGTTGMRLVSGAA